MNHQRRHLLASLAALGLLPAGAAWAAGSLLERIRSSGTVRVGTTGDYFPYSFRDVKSGGFKGYEIEVATRLAADLGVKLQLVQATWPTMVAGLLAGKYEIVASGVTVTPERAKAVGFSKAYLRPTFLPIIQKKDAERFRSWDDIDQPGVVIAVQQGTAPEQMARRTFTKARLLSVADPVIDFTEVLAGRAQAAFTDNLYFMTKIGREYPQLTMVQAGARPGNETENALMTVKGDEPLLDWLDEWVESGLADGFFAGLYHRWFELAAEP
jgi:cyclohexadienyl dehydratase